MARQHNQALDTILAHKRHMLATRKTWFQDIKSSILNKTAQLDPARGFISAIQEKHAQGMPAIIAEYKKASPSKGVLRSDGDLPEVAMAYQRSGACCASVLTEETLFHGSLEDLVTFRSISSLPVLRKDFILDPLQIYEARAYGADCILLILDILTFEQAEDLEALAHELEMDVLLEIHSEKTIVFANRLSSPLIGINNRNLQTLEVDPQRALKLHMHCDQSKIIVAESGIASPDDLKQYLAQGIKTFLIGEALMRANDPGTTLDIFHQVR